MTCFLHHPDEHAGLCSDTELARLFRDGEPRAFDELHRRHGPALRAYVGGLLRGRSESEDVIQDVFLRAVRVLRDPEREIADIRAWLFRVAYNRAMDIIRATRPASDLDDRAAQMADPVSVLTADDELQRTMTALRSLPEAQRRALVLNAVHGESYATVARALDVTPQAAKALAYRGRDHARRAMRAA